MLRSPRRLVASLLLGTLATTLAACGMTSGPTLAPGYGAGTFATRRPAATTHRFGLRFDAQTPRVKYTPGSISADLPAKVDLRAKLSPIEDQGEIGACTGFAITGLAEYRERLHGKTDELSPAFIYLLELKAENNLGQDMGAHISTGMKVLQQYGISPLALHPYLTPAEQADGNKVAAFLSTLPSEAAMKAALPNRVKSLKAINTLDDFKRSIAKGNPVVFGIGVYSSFESDEVKHTGVVPVPDPNSDGFLGGHAILAVGYDDAKQQVVFRNSWNTTWGDKGYGYLPYGYFKKDLVGDAWQGS